MREASSPPSTDGRPGAVLPLVAEYSFSLTPFFIATTAVVLWVVFFATGAIINSQPYRDYLNAATIVDAGPVVAPPAAETAAGAATAPPPAFTSRADFDRAVRDAVAANTALPASPTTSPAQTRQAMGQLLSLGGAFALLMVILTFTPPNIAILAALSALVGAAARWMTDETSAESRARLVTGRRHFMQRRRRAALAASLDGSSGETPAELESMSQQLRRWASGVLLSALARGFFVYLSILSGLLVLTGDPFDSPTPGQYFRLAGTTSLFCFIVGWQPNFLSGLINRFAAIAQTTSASGASAQAKTLTVTEAVTTTQTSTSIPTSPGATVTASAVSVESKPAGETPTPANGVSRPRLDI